MMKLLVVSAAMAASGVVFGQVVPGGPEAGVQADAEAGTGPEPGFFEAWSHSIALGLNGAEGNTENFSVRASLKGERKIESMATGYELTYSRATERSEVTQNRFDARGRNDWLFRDSPRWRYFLTASYEYDDFQNWNHRVTAGNGLGYAFVQEETTLVLGRLGVGLSREIGGEENHIVPEGILGLDIDHKFTERQKITATLEFLPELLDLGPYRARAKAAYEVLLDQESNMSLRLGFEDNYDSTPGAGRRRNDLAYFAMLAWSF
jgi:putative salt-induced outer membrane protein YdiY